MLQCVLVETATAQAGTGHQVEEQQIARKKGKQAIVWQDGSIHALALPFA